MLNPFNEVNWKPDTDARRKFAISLMIGFPILAVMFLLVGRWHSGEWSVYTAITLGGVGAGVGIFLWLLPGVALPFYVVWYGFACCMGFVIGNVLMSLFYFIVVTGIGFALRVAGRDPLRKSPDKSLKTYWKDIPKTSDPRRYYKQF